MAIVKLKAEEAKKHLENKYTLENENGTRFRLLGPSLRTARSILKNQFNVRRPNANIDSSEPTVLPPPVTESIFETIKTRIRRRNSSLA